MKALSVRNPYAAFILIGEKPIECRSWQTDYRGDLLICSSANPKVKNTICGHAICIVRLDSIEPFTKEHLEAACLEEMPEGKQYAWHFTNLRYIKPFPVKGKLNFFEVDDSQIEVLMNADEDIPEEEAQAFYNKYIAPYLYTGQK